MALRCPPIVIIYAIMLYDVLLGGGGAVWLMWELSIFSRALRDSYWVFP